MAHAAAVLPGLDVDDLREVVGVGLLIGGVGGRTALRVAEDTDRWTADPGPVPEDGHTGGGSTGSPPFDRLTRVLSHLSSVSSHCFCVLLRRVQSMVRHGFEQLKAGVRRVAPGRRRGIPPAAYDWLSRRARIDVVQWQLVAQAEVAESSTVLEIGVGTGNVALKVKRAVPTASVIGLDVEVASLALAAKKARRAGVELQLDSGSATRLPYEDASVDRVLCAYVLHHLATGDQLVALQEVRRVLRRGGSFHLLDFTARLDREPDRSALSTSALWRHHREGAEGARLDPVTLLRDARFVEPRLVSAGRSALGGHAFYRADR